MAAVEVASPWRTCASSHPCPSSSRRCAGQLGHDAARLHAGDQHVAVIAVAGDHRIARLQGVLDTDRDGFLADIEVAEAADQPHAVAADRPSPRSAGSGACRDSRQSSSSASRVATCRRLRQSSDTTGSTLRCAVAMLLLSQLRPSDRRVPPRRDRTDPTFAPSWALPLNTIFRALLRLGPTNQPCVRGRASTGSSPPHRAK